MIISAAFVLMLTLIDQLVKYWAFSVLRPIGTINIIPNFFGLTYAENKGAAFSLMWEKMGFLVVLTVAAIAFMIWYVKSGKVTHKVGIIGFLFVIGGALGNLTDRVLHGFVVDMFELQFINFAIFNMADLFITAGGILCAIYFVFFDEEFKSEKSKADSDGK